MIHQFKNNGVNIVMDINSGAIHVTDDLMYDLIACHDEGKSYEEISALLRTKYPDTPLSEVAEVYDEILSLIEDETLFTDDPYEERVIDYTKRPVVVKALCLHIAHDCNLACRYCFAEEGTYHGQKRELMPLEVGKAALDFLVENSGSRRNLEVDFFGGEPLMNFEVVKDIVSYGRTLEKKYKKKFRFTLTTNGVLINDDVIDFVNREIDNVVLSIDGRKEIHDKMRPFPSGFPSYGLVLPKLKKMAESRNGKQYYVRGTYTRNNLDFSKDVLHLADEGFTEISVEPVVAKETDDYALRDEDLPKLFEEYDALAKELVKRHGTDKAFRFFHFMIDLEGGPCVYKRLSGCGAGTEYLAVTPKGELYPCHQFVGNPEYLMGNLQDGITNEDVQGRFKQCNVYAKESCRDCFAKYYCSGGCAANAYNFHGDILKSYELGCELQKKRIECAIMIQAKLAENADDEK